MAKKRAKLTPRKYYGNVDAHPDDIEWTDLRPPVKVMAVAAKQRTASRSFNSGLWRKPFQNTGGGIGTLKTLG